MHDLDPQSQEIEPLNQATGGDTLIGSLRQARLDLLPVLYALLKTGSVTSAAHALGLTQSAVSQHLKTLRTIFNDELLVPVGRALRRTELAVSLEDPLNHLLEEAEHLLSPRPIFNPRTEEIRIVISTADYIYSLLAPRLVEICSSVAPGAKLEFVPASSTVNLDELSAVDFFIAPRSYGDTFGKRIRSTALWEDRMVCIGAANNTALPDSLRPEETLQFRQVGYRTNPRIPERVRRLIHPAGALETSRACVCVAPSFSVLGEIVARSDCVALVPRILAVGMQRRLEIKISELTDIDTHFEVCAFWSPSSSGKRGHSWAKDLLGQVGSEIFKEYY